VVRPHRRLDERLERPADAVLVETRDRIQRRRQLFAQLVARLLTIGRGGIEPGVEQRDQVGHQLRVGVEGVLDVLLAEPEADLAEILGVRADDRHVAGGEAGAEDETVEVVALHVAGFEGAERRLQLGAAVLVEVDARWHPHPDVVEEHPLRAGPERVRLLVERLETEVVEEREQLRERRRRPFAVDPESPLAGRRVDVVSEQRRQVVGAVDQGSDAPDVPHRPLRHHRRAVRRRGVPADPFEQVVTGLLPEGAEQRRPQTVGPRRRQLVDRAFEAAEVDAAVGLRPAHADRDARQRARPEKRLERALLGFVRGGDGVGDPPGKLGGEPVARQVDEQGHPRSDGVRHFEHPHELALLQPDDVVDELAETRRLELEHQVPRQALQHGPGRPAGVGVHPGRGEVEDLAGLVADPGDLEDADPVGVGRQQPDEPALGLVVRPHDHDGLTLVAEHGRPGVAARDHDRSIARDRRRVDPVLVAELTQPGSGADGERAVAGPVVLGGAEEHELALGEPWQERVDRAQLVHPGAHRRKVLDDAADVLDCTDHVRLNRARRHLVDAVDLDLGPRLDPVALGGHSDEGVVGAALHGEHRVDEQVHPEPVALEDHAGRVDEEGHVVGDHEQHRVRRVPAVAIAVGRDQPHDRFTGRPAPAGGEVGDGDGVDVVELAVVDVAFGELGVVQRQELGEERVVGLTQSGEITETAERLGHLWMQLHVARTSPSRRRCREPGRIGH
jgi:hypothetical protein